MKRMRMSYIPPFSHDLYVIQNYLENKNKT